MFALFSHWEFFRAKLRRNDKGQTAFEYAMLIVLVAVAAFITSPRMTDSVMNVIWGTSSMLERGMSS